MRDLGKRIAYRRRLNSLFLKDHSSTVGGASSAIPSRYILTFYSSR